MKPLSLVPVKPNLDFINKRLVFFIFSLLLICSSIGLYGVKDLNYGIDFKGGILLELRSKNNYSDFEFFKYLRQEKDSF